MYMDFHIHIARFQLILRKPMSKIYGSFTVPMSDWRHVYTTVLNYFNQEITLAYSEATSFFDQNKNLKQSDFVNALKQYFENNETTAYRKFLIETSMLKTNTKIYKPKKNHFQSFNNRTLMITSPDVTVNFNKKENTVFIETQEFDNFDLFLSTNTFISEFLNMVNSFNWPSRTGPSKAVRGCTLIKEDSFKNKTCFLSIGPNPPQYDYDQNEVISTPNHLDSNLIKNIKLTTSSSEETDQPLPLPQDLTEV